MLRETLKKISPYRKNAILQVVHFLLGMAARVVMPFRLIRYYLDRIYSEHVLEHVSARNGLAFLKECLPHPETWRSNPYCNAGS